MKEEKINGATQIDIFGKAKKMMKNQQNMLKTQVIAMKMKKSQAINLMTQDKKFQ